MKKENKVLELFLNEPSKHWHFSEIVRKAGISQDRANHWLKEFKKQNLIRHIKQKGRMPYFIANHTHPTYQNKKKLFALNLMHESGLLNQLQSLKAKTIVIFGSFARSDWHRQSDLDIFIYGNPENFRYGKRWLGRQVEVHTCRTKEEIKAIQSGLINNVINGYFVKGNVQDLIEVNI